MATAAGVLLAETRRRPGRVVLTGLAIAIATVFAAGTLLLGETLRGYLAASSVETPDAAAAAVVLPQRLDDGLDAVDLVAAVSAVDGVAQAVGVWSAYPTVGGDAVVSGTWRLQSDPMHGPLTRLPGPPVAGALPTGPAEVAVSEATAGRTGLGPGDSITIAGDDGAPRTVTVSGVVALTSEGGLNTLVGTPAGVAGRGGSLNQIDVTARPGTDSAALTVRLADAVGVPDAVRTGADQRAAELADTSAAITAAIAGIGVFAGLAVVAAAVVVASTFRIVLTQRRTQFALLRCVGAGRGQLVRAVLAEALVTGLVAGVLGIAAAVLGGVTLLAVLRWSGVEDVPDLVVRLPGLVGVLLVAVLATVVAAVAPAVAVSRIPPLAALGTAGAGDAGAPRTGRRLVLAGVLVALAAASAWLALGNRGGSPELALAVVAVSGMIAFAALVVAGPVLVRGLVLVAGRAMGTIGGGPGRLAAANAAQVPRRTAATLSVLALGVGLTSALLVGLASSRAGAERSITEQFPTDVVVTTPDAGSAGALAASLAGDPRVVATARGGGVFVDPVAGVPGSVARQIVEQAVSGRSGMLVLYAGDARAQVESTLGTAQLVGFGLVGMTALVAVVGVGVTLMLSVTERVRETGLLRAVGLSRAGVRAMVAWEAGVIGAGAAVVGGIIGAVYGVLGIRVLGVASGPPAVPYPTLLGVGVGVIAVAVVSALVPAVRAGRVTPIRALQET